MGSVTAYRVIDNHTEKIAAVGGKRINAKDAIFIIKPRSSIHWGENMSINSKAAKWFTYDCLLVVTNLAVMRLSWEGRNIAKAAHDSVVNEVRMGRVKSMIDLYSLMSKYGNRYGMPIKLAETKLERYYD